MSIKVAVAVPHGGAVHPQLYRAIFNMQNELGSGYEFSYCEVDMASVAKARNMMVEACLTGGVDYIHFVDDDVLVPPNVHWLYQHNADIVSGLYMTRQSPHTPQMYTKATEAENAGKYAVQVIAKGTTQDCSVCGKTVPKDLKDRTHRCPYCGSVMPRDYNSALNIKIRGLEKVGWGTPEPSLLDMEKLNTLAEIRTSILDINNPEQVFVRETRIFRL